MGIEREGIGNNGKIVDRDTAQKQQVLTNNQLNISPVEAQHDSKYKMVLRFLSDYSGRMSGVAFNTGNALLMAKAGIHPDLDTAAGVLFNASAATLYLADKFPTTTYRIQGALGLLGTAAMSAKGMNFGQEQAADLWRVVPRLSHLARLIRFSDCKRKLHMLRRKQKLQKKVGASIR